MEQERDTGLTIMLSGFVAGLAMTIVMALARGIGLTSLNLERGFGSLLLAQWGAGAWILGLIIHLAFSAIFALVYSVGFKRVGGAGWQIGAAFGVVHWVIIGFLAGLAPWVHPLMPNVMAPPGFFAVNSGVFGFFFLLLLHVMFGSIVGSAYAKLVARHPEMMTARPV